jgi:hypothetical protein
VTRRKKKPASEMTGSEIAERVFPKRVHDHLKRVANPDSPPNAESEARPQHKSKD